MHADLLGSDTGTQRSAESPPQKTGRGRRALGAADVNEGNDKGDANDDQEKNLMNNPCKCCRRGGVARAREGSADCRDCRGYFRFAHRDNTPREVKVDQAKHTVANENPAVCQSFVENELQKYIDMKAF